MWKERDNQRNILSNTILRKADIHTVLQTRTFSGKKMKRVTAYFKMFIQRLGKGINKGKSGKVVHNR